MEDAPVIGYQGEHHAPPARPRGRHAKGAAFVAGAGTGLYGAYRVGRRGGWRHPFKRIARLGGKVVKKLSFGRRSRAQGLKALPSAYRVAKKAKAFGGIGLAGLKQV